MKLVIAATGASGSIYLQRLLDQVDPSAHEIHLVMSGHAKQVAKQELGALKIPKSIAQHRENDLNVPFVSGSARFDAMVIVPCSMATLGRIASGYRADLVAFQPDNIGIIETWVAGGATAR